MIINGIKDKEETTITIRNKHGKLKWQWQDNFFWRYLQGKTGRDIRIPIFTGYPTRFYKFNTK